MYTGKLLIRWLTNIMKTQSPFQRMGKTLVHLKKPTSTRPCNTMTVSDKLLAFTTSFACSQEKEISPNSKD